jgi:DNA-binding NarL/FixJ family response regulator
MNTIIKTKVTKNIEKEAINILLVDDHPVLRLGLKKILNRKYKKLIINEAESAREAIEKAESIPYDLAIIDISLKGMSGIALTKHLRFRYPQLPILIISMYDEELYAQRVLDAGAFGYIMKKEKAEDFLLAVEMVLSGKIYVKKTIADKMLLNMCKSNNLNNNNSVAKLNWREFEIFHLIGEGLETNQITHELNISVPTIETYKYFIKTKLNFKNASALKKYAITWVAQQRV